MKIPVSPQECYLLENDEERREEEFPAQLHKEIKFLGRECRIDCWLTLKKMLLRCLPSELRSSFSIRDKKTKRQNLNAFEKKVIYIYEKETGIVLTLPEELR